MNKVVVGLAGLWFALCMVSCEIPESVAVKGSPGVHLPLGKVSEIADEDLAGYLSDARITEMVGSGSTTLYRYNKRTDIRTYLVHYPITELKLDLGQFVRDLNVTEGLVADTSGAVPGAGTYVDIPIPLDTMGDWISVVKEVKFRLNLEMTGSGNVSVQFNQETPQNKDFSVTDNKIQFESAVRAEFSPKTNKITVRVNAPIGTSFKPELDFIWRSAMVNPGDNGKFEGNEKVSISDLTSFLGEGTAFKNVTGYLYVGGIPEQSTMTLTAAGSTLLNQVSIPPKSLGLPQTWDHNSIPGGYVANLPIDFTKAFSSKDEFSLTYNISMSRAEIQSSVGDPPTTIKVDMIIELPLEFIVSTASTEAGYVKLDVGLGDIGGSAGDWFGRTEAGGEDDLFNKIKGAVILVSNIENTILPGASFRLTNNGKKLGKIIHLTEGQGQQPLDIGELTYPFSPQFEILLPIDDQVRKTGTLKVGTAKEVFDFFMVMEATADINITQTF